MNTYPNQNTFIINKEDVKQGSGKSRPYLTAYIDTIQNASKNLTGNSFKLYIYLLSNVNNYTSAFSPRDVADKYGCSVDSARESFKTLINKGYLTLIEGTKTKYVFKDIATTSPISLPSTIANNIAKKKFQDNDTGTIYEWTYKELLANCENNQELAQELWKGAK